MNELKKVYIQINLNKEHIGKYNDDDKLRDVHKRIGDRLYDFLLVNFIPAIRRRIGEDTFIGIYIVDPDFVMGMHSNKFHGIANYHNVIFDIHSRMKLPYDMISAVLNNILFQKQWLKNLVKDYEVYRNPATKNLKPETKKHFRDILDEL